MEPEQHDLLRRTLFLGCDEGLHESNEAIRRGRLGTLVALGCRRARRAGGGGAKDFHLRDGGLGSCHVSRLLQHGCQILMGSRG